MIDLKTVIKQHPGCTDNRAKLKSLLFDLYPSERRLIYIILDAYESGIPQQLCRLSSIDPLRKTALVKQLVDEHGLQEQYASTAVSLWLSAYGINTQKETPQETQPQNIIVHDPHAYAPSTPVSGNLSDYELQELDDGTVEIVKFLGFEKAHTIVPSILNGKAVSGIGVDAYKACTSIETVVISNGIKHIKNGAFAGCTNLRSVQLPTTLEFLGLRRAVRQEYERLFHYSSVGVFQNCIQLQQIDIPNGVKHIGDKCFSECKSLHSVILSDYLISIGDGAFSACKSLMKISFPASLEQIDSRAFLGCERIKELEFNHGLTHIGSHAFKNCVSLERVFCPITISYIGDAAFETGKYVQPADRRRKPVYTRGKIAKLVFHCFAGSHSLQYARATGYPVVDAST